MYEYAKEKYASLGVDTEAAMKRLKDIPISIHCWQGDDVGGYFYPLWLKEHEAARNALDKKGWNRITIEAKGKVVKTWLNGVPVSHWVGDGTYAKGFFGLQVHKAKKGEVHFRNIRVKNLAK